MAFFDKPLDDVAEQDLKNLIMNQIAEQRTLDYKRDLPSGTDKDKVELRADVSSFANAAGGDLIFGMDAKKGVPVDLCGVQSNDADGEILRLEGIANAGVRPRIPGLRSRALPLTYGGWAIIMRIPRSWAAPHMTMNTSDWGRFYSRTSNGKYPLDINEIRGAFLRSEATADRIRNFRVERLAKVVAGETPMQLTEDPKVVLHLVPFASLDPGAVYPVTSPEQHTAAFASVHPVGTATTSMRLNFDGVLKYGQNSYVQLFRNGCIEAVDAQMLRAHEGRRKIPSIAYERALIVALRTYLSLHKQLGVEPPIVLMLSLVGVAGYTMAVGQSYFVTNEHPIDRDALLVPETLIDSYEVPPEQLLKSSLDTVWNAAGWSRSMNFDEHGQWLSPYRQD